MSIESALEYGQRGWKVFPILPRSKAPACKAGFHDASSMEDEIIALWNSRTNLNVGIATGDVSGFWVLDVDSTKGGSNAIESWENKYGSLPETLAANTGGGGKHYLFKIPKGTTIPSNSNRLAQGIDLRGNGGYIVAPPSVHPNGTRYEWVDAGAEIANAPSWLIKLIVSLKHAAAKPVYTSVSEPEGDWTQDDVVSMLDCISSDDRQTWINIGMALKDGGWPVTMWDSWSRSSEKYKMGETFRIWGGFKTGGGISFGTLVHMAQENGWEPKERKVEPLDFSNVSGVDFTEFKNNLKQAQSVTKKEEKQTNKIEIGGVIGDTISWINSTSTRLQPELALMHTIATLGAVFGRRYALQKLNTRTNIYMVAIAESGQGKDNSRNCLPKLMQKAGLEQFSGPEDVRSGPGLLLELKKQPSFVANIDEFGMFMGAISDPKAAGYLKEISTIFTSIYGKSGGFYKGGLTASQPDNRVVLNEPNLCIYGTTTLGEYAASMRKSSINSGKINRFIVFKTPIDFPEPNDDCCYSDPPESLVSRWAQFAVTGLAAAPDIVEQEKTLVMIGDCDKDLKDLQMYQDSQQKKYHASGIGALWVRYRENVLKVAMIISIARNHKQPVLSHGDIEFGKSIVGASLEFMMKFATENMYDSEFQKKTSEFMKCLEDGARTRSAMMSVLRVKPKELDELERALREMGKIEYSDKDRPKRYTILGEKS